MEKDPQQLATEALRDWSKWLIGINVVAATGCAIAVKGGIEGTSRTLLIFAVPAFVISLLSSVVLVRLLASVTERLPLVNADGARILVADFPLYRKLSARTFSNLQLATFMLGCVLFVAWLCCLPHAISHAASEAESERIAFARVIVEEYAKLLSVRAKTRSEDSSSEKDEFKRHDEFELLRIQSVVLPRINAGHFELSVDTNNIAVLILDFDKHDGRLQFTTGRAPNSNDDTALRQAIRERTRGNRFAEEAFVTAGFK